MGARDECYAAVGAAHPDLVAVYESRQGHLALLLRQTVVPLVEERGQWLAETRSAAASIIGALRQEGVRERCLVLQWQPLAVVGHVFRYWRCRYAGDRDRLGQLRRVVERVLDDRAFVAGHHTAAPVTGPPGPDAAGVPAAGRRP
jgi:hypothetical protein